MTLESTHKKLLSILETGTILIGEHTVRAFLLYPNSSTSQAAHLMTSGETSANNSPRTSVDYTMGTSGDYTLGTLSPLGGSGWSSGSAFDSVEAAGESSSKPNSRPSSRPSSRTGFAPRKELYKTSDSESPVELPTSSVRNSQQDLYQPEERVPKHEGEPRSLPQAGPNRKQSPSRNQANQLPKSSGGVVLAPPHESSVYSAIERMLLSSKTGIHPVQLNQGLKRPQDQNTASNHPNSTSNSSNYQQYSSNSGVPERCKSPTSASTISVDGSEPSDRTIIPTRHEQVTSSRRKVTSPKQSESSSSAPSTLSLSPQLRVKSSQSQATPARSAQKSVERPHSQRPRRRATSSERELKKSPPANPLSTLQEDGSKVKVNHSNLQSQIPPPKPKRTQRPSQSKQVNGGTKGTMLAEAMQRGGKPAYDSSRKVSFKDKPQPHSSTKSKMNNKVVRNVSVQYEEMPPDFSDFMLDQEDSYFCKLDGLVKLMKERPTSQETEDLLLKVRKYWGQRVWTREIKFRCGV